MSILDRFKVPDEARENGRQLRESEPPVDFPQFIKGRGPALPPEDLDQPANEPEPEPTRPVYGLDGVAVLVERLCWADTEELAIGFLGDNVSADPTEKEHTIYRACKNIVKWSKERVAALQKQAD